MQLKNTSVICLSRQVSGYCFNKVKMSVRASLQFLWLLRDRKNYLDSTDCCFKNIFQLVSHQLFRYKHTHVCTHKRARTCTHTHAHTCTHPKYIHTCMHTHANTRHTTYAHTCTQTCKHTAHNIRTHTHTCICLCRHMHAHTHMQTHGPETYMKTRHTMYAHAHTCADSNTDTRVHAV